LFAVEKLSNRRMTIDKCCAADMWSGTSSSADVAAENNIKEKMNYWASRFGHSLTQHLPGAARQQLAAPNALAKGFSQFLSPPVFFFENPSLYFT